MQPSVTILKPLCGADPDLRDNLESFFNQDYQNYQIIFGVENSSDPAVEVVHFLKNKYPEVECKLIVHSGSNAMNPKVRNLLGMLPHATHDLLLISDSNIRAPQHYLNEMIEVLLSDRRVGLVTNIFAGSGENTFGAALENVQLNGFCASGAALPTAFGDALVVGKSMLFSRRALESLGGFERVANVLAEDYVIGKVFQHAGYRVRIAPTVLLNVTKNMTFSGFLQRHLRWAMIRWRLRPLAFLLEVLTSPLALLPWASLIFGIKGAIIWVILLLLTRDVAQWVLLRGWKHLWLVAALAPIRELCMLTVWLQAPFKRHIAWRGKKVRLGAGTLLFGRQQLELSTKPAFR